MSAPRWTEAEYKAHEYKLARKGIILHDQKPGNKYRNKIIEAHGRKFDSKKEAARYNELVMMEKARLITNLQCQQKFVLEVNEQIICSYIADFVYTTLKTGENDIPEPEEYIVEDVKSNFTRKLPVYRIKKKLMYAIYNIEISEV